jgi:hypothetical protein
VRVFYTVPFVLPERFFYYSHDFCVTHAVAQDGSTVFHFAVLGGDLPTIDYIHGLLSPANARATNAFGCGAPHWAAAAGNVEVAEWLFARGFDFSELNDSKHGVVGAAAWKGHRPMLSWLLRAPNGPRLVGQLHNRDHGGHTAADHLRNDGRLDLARWLESFEEKGTEAPNGIDQAAALSVKLSAAGINFASVGK